LILQVKAKRKQASGEDQRRLRYLQAFLVDQSARMTVRNLTDTAETMQAKETVTVNKQKIPFRLTVVKIINEPNRQKRHKLYQARDKVIDKINVVLKERMEKLHEVSKKIGYKNYLDLYKDTRNVDFYTVEEIMQSFIRKTEDLYVEEMGNVLKDKLGLELEEAEKHDVAFLFRAQEFDKYFLKEKAVETLKKALANMGVFLDRQRNIFVDDEERPKKSPRAFCSPIKVPEEIKLVVMPSGGHDDYAALLHEAGHAVHHGCTDSTLPVEFRRLGDNSVTETYAFLLEYLLEDENWLRQHVEIDRVDDYLRFLNLYKLFFLRRYGAKISYEIKLHSKGIEGMGTVYKQTLERSLKFRHPERHYLMDLDDGFYCAMYLRAWIFEAQLRAYIKRKYGVEWFRSAEAGDFVRKLWSYGQKYDVVELARMIGYSGLDVEPLIVSIQNALS